MSEPRRLHPAAAVLLALRIARELALPAIFPLALQFFRRGFDALSLETAALTLAALSLLLGVSTIYGVLAWRRYTYRVEAGELRTEQGVITRKSRHIPLERIQAVDLTQGVLQRLLGIVSVRVQTASGGNGSPEVFLPGVSKRDGEALQQALAARPLAAPEIDMAPEGGIIRRLSVPNLLLAGSTAGRVGIALSLFGALITVTGDALPVEQIAGLPGRITGLTIVLVTASLAASVIWVLGVAGTVLAHAGFTLTRDGETLLIERGLLERRRATIPVARIQAVRIVEGIVRQPFGLVELRVESAGYGTTAGESSVLFPLLRRDEVLPFLREMAPPFAVQADLRRPPERARRRYATRLTLVAPAAAVAVLAAAVFFPAGLSAFVLLPGAALLGLWQYRDAGWAVSGDTLLLRERQISRTTVIMSRRRIQQGETRQTPFQHRARLASFSVRVASGSGGTTFGLLHMGSDDAVGLISWLSAASRTRAREQPA